MISCERSDVHIELLISLSMIAIFRVSSIRVTTYDIHGPDVPACNSMGWHLLNIFLCFAWCSISVHLSGDDPKLQAPIEAGGPWRDRTLTDRRLPCLMNFPTVEGNPWRPLLYANRDRIITHNCCLPCSAVAVRRLQSDTLHGACLGEMSGGPGLPKRQDPPLGLASGN